MAVTFLLRLRGLVGFLVGGVLGDVTLQLLDVHLLLLPLPLLDLLLRVHQLKESRVIASVMFQLTIRQPDDAIDNCVEKVLRVADHQQALLVIPEEILKPDAGLKQAA